MRFTVRLETEAPLAISQGRATGNELTTLKHIPGTVWRGALAAAVMRANNLKPEDAHQDNEFKTLFLSGQSRFGDLRVQGDHVYPLSARICKQDDSHGPSDLLLLEALDVAEPRECKCGGKLTRIEGYYEWNGWEPKKREIHERLTAHSAISNRTLNARAGQFFTSAVLEAGQVFRGSWDVDVQAEAAAERWVGKAFVTIGRGATRGQGHATIQIQRADDENGEEELRARLRELNEPFAERGLLAFTCTLQSPCIVYDDWLLARSWLTIGDIAEAAGATLEDFAGYESKRQFSRMVTMAGWNAQRGLPKPETHAIAAGSAFLFTRVVSKEERADEIHRLGCLLWNARQGIGERWEEGFGEAIFCDEFHYRRVSP